MSSQEQANKMKAALKKGKVPHDLEIPGWSSDYPLLPHQKTAVLWQVLTPKGLIADTTGTGKTCQSLGLLQWLKSKEQLSPKSRAIIIVPAISVYGSWKADGFDKFVPDMNYAIGRGTKKQRRAIYADPTWEVLLTNYETARNDVKELVELGFDYVVLDEADAVRNHDTKTARAVKRITRHSKRVIAMTATPIQNHLVDLHGILEACGLGKEFGSLKSFRARYQRYVLKKVFYAGRWRLKKVVSGYKNTPELKERIDPYYLRRTYKDIDVKVPEMESQVKWVEMTSEQRRIYYEVQSGMTKLTPDSPYIEIKAALLRLRQVCTTTANMDETVDYSGKLDWFTKQMQGDWQDEKVVVFSNWKASIRALEVRLSNAGVKYVTMTGDQADQQVREAIRKEFWEDKDVKVLIGTTAIEKSLNLQIARIQVNLDLMFNPSRHNQLAGRVQRIGSEHDEAYVFSLLTRGTVEEGMLKLLESKQAIADHIFDEESEIFEKLSAEEMLKLLGVLR